MDIMQAYVTEYLQYKNVNMWTDYFAIRHDVQNGKLVNASSKYRDFCRVWRGKHPEFGTAQGMLKELLRETKPMPSDETIQSIKKSLEWLLIFDNIVWWQDCPTTLKSFVDRLYIDISLSPEAQANEVLRICGIGANHA